MPSLSSHPCPGCARTSYINLLVPQQSTVLLYTTLAPALLSSTSLCLGPGLMMSTYIVHGLLRCQMSRTAGSSMLHWI